MAKKKQTRRTITYKGFFFLPAVVLQCRDFIDLKGSALKLLIDLGSQYNGYNNGDLCAGMSVMRKRGWNSNQQLTKGTNELLKRNLITQTRQGGLHLGPNLYAFTWQPIDKCAGKLDVEATTSAARSFKD